MSTFRSRCLLFSTLLLPALPAQDGKAPPPSPAATTGTAEATAKRTTASGLVVGVVDLGKAFDLYPRTVKEREKLQKLADSYREQISGLEKRMDEVKALLGQLKEGTRQRAQAALELELAQAQRRGLIQLADDDIQQETLRMQLAIYEDLEKAVQQVAKDKGVHLVLRIDAEDAALGDADKNSPKQVSGRLRAFEMRQVLFASEELDLTASLIKLLQVPLEPVKPEAPGGAADGAKKEGN